MFTDIVGFSALTQHDEPAALRMLEEHRGILRPIFPRFGGRAVKTIGDAFLVEFGSALEATECAIEAQRLLFERNRNRPQDKIEIRIGIHVGDVVHLEQDVYGDAVNIASRIEPLAEPSGICITGPVQEQVANKLPALYKVRSEDWPRFRPRQNRVERTTCLSNTWVARYSPIPPRRPWSRPLGERTSPRTKQGVLRELVPRGRLVATSQTDRTRLAPVP